MLPPPLPPVVPVGRALLQPLLDQAGLSSEELTALAVGTGALQANPNCRKKVQTGDDVLDLVVLYTFTEVSFRVLSTLCCLAGRPLTDEAIRLAVHRAEAFLEALVARLMPAGLLALAPQSCRRVVVADATTLSGLAPRRTDLRLHTLVDLGNLRTVQVHLTDAKTAESLALMDLGEGDLVVADRGLCHAKALATLRAVDIEVLVRFNPFSWPGTTPAQWAQRVADHPPGTVSSWALDHVVDDQTTHSYWVHALVLPPEVAERKRRKYRKKQRKQGRTASKVGLLLCGVLLVLSSLPPSEVPAAQALAWYRRRWQIELLFKRWKSLLRMSELRCQGASPLARVWVWGKLMMALAIEHALLPRREAQQQLWRASLWSMTRLMRQWLVAQCFRHLPSPAHWPDELLQNMVERRRRRNRQPLAHDILEVLNR